ncbi:MAG: lipopolysaccharide heptosyltransferase family protein, partial [Actinobacteria bacterium]|nr:lipopolysaccharide heptosyltransferase family protein [Actinomycetota bacterium]
MKKILIYNSGGGIGDAVQIINLLISLHDHYKAVSYTHLTLPT